MATFIDFIEEAQSKDKLTEEFFKRTDAKALEKFFRKDAKDQGLTPNTFDVNLSECQKIIKIREKTIASGTSTASGLPIPMY